jgi:hypothetical protein
LIPQFSIAREWRPIRWALAVVVRLLHLAYALRVRTAVNSTSRTAVSS